VLHCSDFCSDPLILLHRGCANNFLRPKFLELLHRHPFLFSGRMDVAHCHQNARVAQQRTQRRKVYTRRHCPRRKSVAKIVEPEVAFDLCALNGGTMCLLHAANGLLDVVRRRKHIR